MSSPRYVHLVAIKHSLGYLHGAKDYGLLFQKSTCTQIIIFVDIDWTSYLDDRRSTSGYSVFLEFFASPFKKYPIVSQSNIVAKYISAVNICLRICLDSIFII